MTARIIDGKLIAEQVRGRVAQEAARLARDLRNYLASPAAGDRLKQYGFFPPRDRARQEAR